MKKNLAKRLVVAAILTTWIANVPAATIADAREEFTSGTTATNQVLSGTTGKGPDEPYVGNGGAVNAIDAGVTLGGTFENNSATANGGALSISNYGNALDVEAKVNDNTVFKNNSATNGGAISNSTGSFLNIGNDVDFIGNKGIYAGAILNQRAALYIGDRVLFQENSSAAGNSGGALVIEADDGKTHSAIIGTNAEFINNKSGNSGGAIYVFESKTYDTQVSSELQVQIGDGAIFTANGAEKNGGAVAVYGAESVDIGTNATFEGNSASKDGGAIYVSDYYSDANITINDGTKFIGNEAGGNGGAIYNAAENLTLNTGANGISFVANTSASGANDIYAAAESKTNITGSGNVSIGSGIISAVNSNINVQETSHLVIENGATAQIGGSVSTTADASVINKGEMNITGSVTGNVENNSNLHITDGATFNGKLNQRYDGAVTTIDNGATITITDSAVNVIEGGTIKFGEGGKLNGDMSITEAVKVEIAGDSNIIDADGLKVGDTGHIVSDAGLNLAGDFLVNGGVLGTSVIISDGSINSQPAGSDITINDPHTLTLSNNATSDKGFIVNQNGTLKLAPTEDGSLTLEEQNKITGDGNILVDEIVITKQVLDPSSTPDNPIYTTVTEHMGVGTITINSDNSGFTGNYEQNDGHVIVSNGATFFAGQKNDINGGILDLHDGAILKTTIDANAGATADDYGIVLVRNEVKGTGAEGAITANDLNTAQSTLTYVNSDNSEVAININQAGLGLFNNTVINEDVTLEGTGAKHLLFGDGSGINGDITLQDGTSLTYADDAFVKQDSTLTLNNAELIFANDKNVNYNPEIQGAGTISMIGDGTTSIASALNEQINIAADYGTLNLNNTSTTGLGDIAVDGAKLNVAAKELATVGTIDVSGDGAAANFSGNILNGGNASVSGGASLGLFGNATLGNLNLDGILNTMGGNIINTINVNDLTVGQNSSVSFDVDPRTQATDILNAGNIINNGNNQILVSGINFTRSPIDYNVLFDISNVVQQGGTAAGQDLIRLPDGGVIANSAMGQYLITSSGAGNPILNASLLALNPQMYRGQVATLASWQNQLVVNNMLFDHMNVLTRQLMDEEKTANKYAAAYPQFAPYQYDLKGGSLWYKAYGNFERLSMTRGLSVGNNAYGSLIGADFPLIKLKNGWNLVPTAYIAYNGAHQTFNGVSMYQNGAQLGFMGTAYKGDFITSLLAYGGGYANDMSVRGQYGSGSDTTGNWFAGVASKTAYNFHLPYDLIFQPTFMAAYNAFGQQNWGSNFGAMSMSSGMLNGINVAPGFNLIWQKKTFSIYATAQMVYNVMGGVDGKAGNIDLGYVRMRHSYFEYGLGVMKKFKDRFTGYLQITFRNGGRTGVGFQGGLQWKIGK